MKKKWYKKLVVYVLVGVIASGSVMVSYDRARRVEAAAVVDDVALITFLLLAFGYVSVAYYNNTDGSSALADEIENEYESARFTVLNGGAGDPDDDNSEYDSDGDGKVTEKDLPPFSTLRASSKANLALSAGMTKLLAPIVTGIVGKKYGQAGEKPFSDVYDSAMSAIQAQVDAGGVDPSAYNSYFYRYKAYSKTFNFEFCFTNDLIVYGLADQLYLRLSNDAPAGERIYCYKYYTDERGKTYCNFDTFTSGGGSRDFWTSYGGNVPIFPTWQEGEEYFRNGRIDWVTPDLQDTFANKGNLELLPSFDPTANYNIPTLQALQSLLQNLNGLDLDNAAKLNLVNQYLHSLQINPGPEPDPGPAPDPGENPDKPGGGGEDGGGGSQGGEEDNSPFLADLKTLFPFCIPFDLIDCFRIFNADPVTPSIEVPVHFGIVNYDHTFVFDLHDFDGVAKVFRTMMLIMFIVGLVLVTRALIKG